ncbi:GNAT family N-acetyltransferase [Streptomyces sp. NPDC058405]|uniref:GNAT family N-acetyltransferase n=1 Tax=Streptomyces sp. NPDC058405 TaxID=3346482 RepID=UPI003656C51F
MTAPVVRLARAGDADELTRVHVEGGLGHVVTDVWRNTHRADLARRLLAADPDLVAVVAVGSDGAGMEIVSAAVGFIHPALCRPGSPAGRSAHLASVATLPRFRRSGYATAVTAAFITEVQARGCPAVTLTATDAGACLYRELGFAPHPRAMRLDLSQAAVRQRRPLQPYAVER